MFVAAPGPQSGGREHHFNFAQKIFQVGDSGTLGMTMWGLGSLPGTSYRTLIAKFADDLIRQPATSMSEIADRWNVFFWTEYSTVFSAQLQRTHDLQAISQRTPSEDLEFEFLLQNLSGGFCVGGCCVPDRRPEAFEVTYAPDLSAPPQPQPQAVGSTRFWGCPNLINRLLYGADFGILSEVLNSGKWTGTPVELFQLVQPFSLGQPEELPIREAIDWVHGSIYATIKTMKFSHMAPVCGGPIEIAVITTDRPFRWVRHKSLDAAVAHDGFSHV